ncbi:MAG: DNA translocase FtsK [Anaerolineae bacterium]|nr:DNA translocase FtsK [Anaerolineae bacterium]
MLPSTSEQTLEYQADQIELILTSHRVPGHVLGGTVTPRWIRYHILPELTTKLAKISALSDELALRLGVKDVRVSRQGSAIQIEVPRADGQTVHLLNLCQRLADIPRQSAILGLDEAGLPLLLRLASPEVAHVLIAGTTGSGKTALARSMALSLAMHNRLGEVQMIFIDPKGTGFGVFSTAEVRLPHLLRPLVRDVHQAIFLLGEVVNEMLRRDRENISEPRLVIFIDELADLMEQGGKAMDRLMTRLTQRGRSAGIHLVACTQKPLAAAIGSLTRSNFPVRLVGSVTGSDDAKVAAGIAGTRAEKLLGRGDFILVAKGQMTRFQAAYVDREEIQRIVHQLQQGGRTSRRWIEPADPPRIENLPLAATGTEGAIDRLAPTGSKRRQGLELMFGHQLRLIK